MEKMIETAIKEKEAIGMFDIALKLMWIEQAAMAGMSDTEVADNVIKVLFETL